MTHYCSTSSDMAGFGTYYDTLDGWSAAALAAARRRAAVAVTNGEVTQAQANEYLVRLDDWSKAAQEFDRRVADYKKSKRDLVVTELKLSRLSGRQLDRAVEAKLQDMAEKVFGPDRFLAPPELVRGAPGSAFAPTMMPVSPGPIVANVQTQSPPPVDSGDEDKKESSLPIVPLLAAGAVVVFLLMRKK